MRESYEISIIFRSNSISDISILLPFHSTPSRPPLNFLYFLVSPFRFFHPPPLETSPCPLGERVSKKENVKGRGWLVRGEATLHARGHAPAPVENWIFCFFHAPGRERIALCQGFVPPFFNFLLLLLLLRLRHTMLCIVEQIEICSNEWVCFPSALGYLTSGWKCSSPSTIRCLL